MTDYTQRAKDILQTIRYATLATVSADGQPWNSPVAHEYDADLNIYWFSDKEGQHSRNVRANGNAFIVIYDSTVPEGEGEGVYIEAQVSELNDPAEILRVRQIKKGPDYQSAPGEFLGDAVRRVYKAEPLHIWMNDAEEQNGEFVRDYRVEIPIEALRALFK